MSERELLTAWRMFGAVALVAAMTMIFGLVAFTIYGLWRGTDQPRKVAVAALARESRFADVSVEMARTGRALNLTGRVVRGVDKWDARGAVFEALYAARVSGIAVFNNIVSAEPDPMPGPDTNAEHWRLYNAIAR